MGSGISRRLHRVTRLRGHPEKPTTAEPVTVARLRDRRGRERQSRLRPEKPWLSTEGPGFDSRHLHQPTNQPTNPTTNQPNDQPTQRPTNPTTNQPNDQPATKQPGFVGADGALSRRNGAPLMSCQCGCQRVFRWDSYAAGHSSRRCRRTRDARSSRDQPNPTRQDGRMGRADTRFRRSLPAR